MPYGIEFKRLLVAIDFTEISRRALDYAIAIGCRFRSTLILLHVLGLSDPAIEAELETHRSCTTRIGVLQQLEVLASGIDLDGVHVETHVKSGIPAAAIMEAVTAYSADMLIIGVQGTRKGLGHLLIGSNAEKLLMEAPCPTLTIGPRAHVGIPRGSGATEILYLSDFTPEAVTAAPYAVSMARAFDARIDVCQFMPTPGEGDPLCTQLVDRYCKSLRRVVPDAYADLCHSAFQIERATAVEQVTERAIANRARMIVLGIEARSFTQRHLHACLAYRLVAEASCPVLTIREMERKTDGHPSSKDRRRLPA